MSFIFLLKLHWQMPQILKFRNWMINYCKLIKLLKSVGDKRKDPGNHKKNW